MNNKKVLVTGADGFIGSHLVERLVKDGWEVRATALYNSSDSIGWLKDMEPRTAEAVEIVTGDIRDARSAEAFVKGCDYIAHLAAFISVPYSFQSPRSFIDTNVFGTLNTLEAAVRYGCQRFIQTSSSEVYGSPKSVPIFSNHPLKAQSPYAASKIAADKLAESFFYSYELPAVILRPFNTYGPRQSNKAILPTVLTQILNNQKEIKLGSLWPRRDMTYVSDTVDGFVKAFNANGVEGKTIQLGTGMDYSVEELVNICIKLTNSDSTVKRDNQRIRPNSSEVDRLISNSEEAGKLLAWLPKVSIENGVSKTISWMKSNLHHYSTQGYIV